MQYFDIEIAPGQVREINILGSFVYFLSGSAGGADTTVELRAASGSDTILLQPGQAFRLGARQAANQRWVLSNHAGQGTIIGILLMGDGDFSDNRVSGSVEVIDGGKARTMAAVSFLSRVAITAGAATYATVQLWNPATSGMNCIIESYTLGSVQAQGLGVKIVNQALATLAAPANPLNKLSGGPASVMELRYAVPAAANSVAPMQAFIMGVNMIYSPPLKEPIVLRPGYGFLVGSDTAATSASLNVEHFEERI